MLDRLASRISTGFANFRQTEQLFLVLVAVTIGVLAGFGSVGFRLLLEGLQEIFWHRGEYTREYIASLPVWWKVAVPAGGGLIVGLITYHFAPEAKGHGVPEVMEAVALRGGRMRVRVVLAKMFGSGVSIASGGSVGREGPIVQIGAAIGSALGQWIRIDPRRLKTLVGCGAAAGIAGTFNAPVAGSLFAVEIILGDFGVAQFSPIVISAVTSTVISHHFLGNVPAFEIPAYSLVSPGELGAYAVLGLVAGLVAVGFVRTLYFADDTFDRIRVYPPLRTALGGLLVGIIGIWAPHVFGVGYDTITDALHGSLLWQTMLALVAVKILAVAVTIGSGGSGGVFAPSLFIGAMLGGVVGTGAGALWPDATGGVGAYSLVGMGAIVAAATHAPITAILIIFELTGDYDIILPLMIACIIATLLASHLDPASIYTRKLLRRGVDIFKGRAINVLQGVAVSEIMRRDMVTVLPGERLGEVVSRFMDHPGQSIFVSERDGRFRGIITANRLRPVMGKVSALDSLLLAQDLVGEGQSVAADASLADVMRRLARYGGEVPVLEDGRLVGTIWPQDVIERYNEEIFKRDMARSMVSVMHRERFREPVPAIQDTLVEEIPVPGAFVGRSIGDLDVRRNLGVTVLMVLPEGGTRPAVTPTPEYVFRAGDQILAMGDSPALTRLRTGA